MTYILFNPNAGKGNCQEKLNALGSMVQGEAKPLDITTISNYAAFIAGLAREDVLLIAGGDGTLNRFINNTDSMDIPQDILYYPTGSGNDFAHELGIQDRPVSIKKYLKNLPTVTVNGKTYRFLNGVGYGIDGYCCEVGDKLRKTGKKVDYTAIAIKGLLFHYKPTRAAVKVDGKGKAYRKVWIAPTMNGKFYGGGMMPTPEQDRFSGKLSTMVFHNSGKLKTLMIFPSLFKGEHVKHKKQVEVLSGKEITVIFDRPTALQIDGETILDVTSYTARVSE